jgi:hypothetical protein
MRTLRFKILALAALLVFVTQLGTVPAVLFSAWVRSYERDESRPGTVLRIVS